MIILNEIRYQKYVKSKKVFLRDLREIQNHHEKRVLYMGFQNKYQSGSPNWKMADDYNNNDFIFISLNKLSVNLPKQFCYKIQKIFHNHKF